MYRLRLKEKKGQALVELALVMPILILLLSGIFEFGRIFSAELIVTHCAREGARLGSVGALDSDIINRVQNTASGLDTSQLAIVISPTEGNRERGSEVNVSVDYSVNIVTPFISVITGESVNVEASSSMRVE